MKIAVLSDIHDHIDKLNQVLKQINGKVEVIIFCGDLISPFTTGILAQANLPTYACLGNNDEDHIGMFKKGGSNFTWIHLSQEFGEVELGRRKIAFCHYPKLGELLAKTNDYDAVFFGHTHEVVNKTIGKTLLLNPGAVCGINFDKGDYDLATFAFYDTSTNKAEIVKFA
ncbi:MAG: metallophosphoesterase [Candidatus Chisholmbacteria bacterium]|nr:metallophosphoesterase [Candidatus Chisholmbacteria bacterium]